MKKTKEILDSNRANENIASTENETTKLTKQAIKNLKKKKKS